MMVSGWCRFGVWGFGVLPVVLLSRVPESQSRPWRAEAGDSLLASAGVVFLRPSPAVRASCLRAAGEAVAQGSAIDGTRGRNEGEFNCGRKSEVCELASFLRISPY